MFGIAILLNLVKDRVLHHQLHRVPHQRQDRVFTYINRTPVSKTRSLSPYQLTHDKVMQAWTSDIHAVAQQEPTGGAVFILYRTQSSSCIIPASTK